MTAANFWEEDLIYLETVLENAPLSMEWNHRRGVYQPLGKEKLNYRCDWLKIGKKERCGKPCKQFYCRAHCDYMNRGGIKTLPCLCCGQGTIQYNQFCVYCEADYGVGLK